jgi:hypothetical protein
MHNHPNAAAILAALAPLPADQANNNCVQDARARRAEHIKRYGHDCDKLAGYEQDWIRHGRNAALGIYE